MTMYSPRIREDLIPKLYKLAEARNKPMTQMVDEILRDYLDTIDLKEVSGTGVHELQIPEYREVYLQKERDHA